MAGHKASISVEWSIKNRQALTTPYAGGQNTLSLKIENALCTFRDLTHMVSVITAKRSEGTMTIEDFRAESENVLQKCYTWWDRLDPVILKGAEQIAPLTSSNPDESYPFKPALLYTGARWAVNFLHLDYYGLVIVLKHQIALTSGGDIDPASLDISSLSDLAIKICGVLAAMEAYNDTPAGALLAGQAPIGLAALWIPNFPQYRRWVQKQLANAEKMG